MDFSEQLKKLKGKESDISGDLRASPTALTKNAEPTNLDVQNQLNLERVKKERSKLEAERLEKRWYGDAPKEEAITRQGGLVSRAIQAFTLPLYAEVGAVESLLGKGSKKGLANIPANIKERGLYGDILRQYNIPNIISMPLGFSLDVAGDPLTWASVGTSAVIPRVAVGVGKAGIKGGLSAVSSSALSKGAFLGRLIPGLKKSPALKSLVKKSAESSSSYDSLIGRDFMGSLNKGAGRSYGNLPRLGDVIEKKINTYTWGDQTINFLKYKNKDWFEAEKKMEELIYAQKQEFSGQGSLYVGRNDPKAFKALEDMLDMNKMDAPVPGEDAEVQRILKKIRDSAKELAGNEANLARSLGSEHNALRFGGESVAEEESRKALDTLIKIKHTKSGIYALDDLASKMTAKSISLPNGKKLSVEQVFDVYKNIIQTFKITKIGLSPSAYINGIAGNPTMAWMYGLNIFNPEYLRSIRGAWKMISGKVDKRMVNSLVSDHGWASVMDKYPSLFQKTYHFNPQFLTSGKFFNDMTDAYVGAVKESGRAEAVASLPKEFKEVAGLRNDLLNSREVEAIIQKNLSRSGMDVASIPGKALGTETGFIRSGMLPEAIGESVTTISAEIYEGSFRSMLKNLKSKGDAGNGFAKFAYAYLTKPMSLYEKIDQSFKLGTSFYTSMHGLSQQEIIKIKRFIDLSSSDLIKESGRYKLSPLKSMQLSHDVYMNYLAMPGAVKILRALPILGAPFASFTYGMLVKTGRTALYNPSAFSRIEQMLQEFSGQANPVEKKALELPYYQWYKDPGMVKIPIPFLEQNPVYINMTNMLPYYTLNMFTPGERKYKKTLSSNIMSILDKSPFLKTPEGQLLLDYFIQPMILNESNPQGMFGQQLYPVDATNMEKAGLFTRSAAETFTPTIAAPIGPVTAMINPDLVKALPNYRWRQLGEAVQGKNVLGIPGKEHAASRTLRSILATLGFSLYPLNTSFSSSKLNNGSTE